MHYHLIDTGYISYAFGDPERRDYLWNHFVDWQHKDAFVCVDSSNSIRKDEFPSYKQNRQTMKDTITYEQAQEVKQIIRDVNPNIMTYYEWDGYEADDIIGYLSYELCHDGATCHITGVDKDLLQLPNVTLSTPSGQVSTIHNYVAHQAKTLQEHITKEPTRWDILKILVVCGDVSDNIERVGRGVKFLRKVGNFWYERNFFHLLYDEYGEIVNTNLKLAMLPHYSLWNEEFTLDYIDELCYSDGIIKCKDIA